MEVTRIDGIRWAVIGAARSVMHPQARPHEFEVELDGSATALRFEMPHDSDAPQRLTFRSYPFARVGA